MNGHVYETEHGQDLNQYAKVNKYHPKKFRKVGFQTDPLIVMLLRRITVSCVSICIKLIICLLLLGSIRRNGVYFANVNLLLFSRTVNEQSPV